MNIAVIESKFVPIMQAVGRDFAKGLTFAVHYLPPAAALASLLFPSTAPIAAEVVSSVTLVQNAVALVEQKYAAANISGSSTGPQKLGEVLTLTESAVTQLLAQAGIKADTDFITRIVNAVVAILNVQQAPAVPASTGAITKISASGSRRRSRAA